MGNFEWTNREEGMGTAQNEWVPGARKRSSDGRGHNTSIMGAHPPRIHPSSTHWFVCHIALCPFHPYLWPFPSTTIFSPFPHFLLWKWFNQVQKMANIFANIFLILAICLSSKFCHSAIQLPFGVEQGDEVGVLIFPFYFHHLKQLHFDDSPLVRRDPPGQFSYFERPFNSIYIAQNGAISMGVPFGEIFPIPRENFP